MNISLMLKTLNSILLKVFNIKLIFIIIVMDRHDAIILYAFFEFILFSNW